MSNSPSPTKKSNIGLWLGGAAILLVALIAVLVLLLNRQPAPAAPTAAIIVAADTATPEPATATPTIADTPTLAPIETSTSTPMPELGTSNLFIEYILDASGSMSETLSDGSLKIDVAQRVLTEHMRSFRPETNIGLRVYGHRLPYQQTDESCQDIELIAPPEKGQMERIVGWLQDFTVQGMTPLAASLELARDDFVYDASRVNSIVMLSDGIETCGGDPCRLVEDLKAEGINFTIHVIGLDVDDPTRQQLTCIAEAGGGSYHDAKNQQELNAALGAVQTDVTQDEIIVPPGVNTPTPAPTATPSPSPTSVLADFTSPIAYILDGNIWLIQPATGQQHKLIDFDSVPVWSPAWSSDGKQLAFGIAGSEMKGDIGILNLESGETRQLGLPDKSDDWHGSAIDLAWTADNSMIYYSMSTEPMGRYRRLRRVRSDGSGRVEIPSISRNWEWEGFPAFSPDGRWMTFGMMQKYYLLEWPADYWAIWGAQADESGSQQLVTGLSGQSSWSPDSTQMAYDTYWFKGNPGNNSIHLMDARGNHIRQLTSNGLAPSWAPNGQEVAFIRTTADGTAEVWIINVDGSNARKLTDGSEPAWRPILAGSSD